MEKLNIEESLRGVVGDNEPHLVAQLNGQEVKLVKFKGTFV